MRWWQQPTGPDHHWRWMERRPISPVEGGDTYMLRYTLIGTPWGDIKVHRILTPDDARDLHDHPWSFVSVILRGGYTEELPTVPPREWSVDPDRYRVRRRPGTIHRMPAEGAHRIADLHGDCWTLVISGPRSRIWGFWVGGKWVDWKTYCGADA